MRAWIVFALGLTLIFAVAAKQQGGAVQAVDGAVDEAGAPARTPPLQTPTWKQTGVSRVRKEYYQGVTADPRGNLYFDGIWSGLYRTTRTLKETARNEHAIPRQVRAREGYNHLGDISWDRGEGGRLLLPVQCFSPVPGGRAACKSVAIAVADPATLHWRYYVKLGVPAPHGLAWVEASPDGKLVWTSVGTDLLAFSARSIRSTNAAPSPVRLKPARRLADVVPLRSVTGGTFYRGLLLLAGPSRSGTMQVWAVDPLDGSSTLELERSVNGESEGLGAADALGGSLQWQIGAHTTRGRPTYGRDRTALLHFELTHG